VYKVVVVALLLTIHGPRCVVPVELSQEKEFVPGVADPQPIILILKFAVLAKYWPRVVFDLPAAGLPPTIHKLSCTVLVESSPEKDFGPRVVGTLLTVLIRKSAAPAE